MKNFLTLLHFIWNHPLNRNSRLKALANFFRWQICQIVFRKKMLIPWVGDSQLLVGKGETGLTGNIYVGLMEFEDMAFVLHCLRPTDLFLDIGANAGVYTILSSKVVGARSIAFEPIAETIERLTDQVNVNRIREKVVIRNVGIGNENCFLTFTNNSDTINKVSLKQSADNTTKVEVKKLDDEIAIQGPTLLKIDVEGFEYNVIEGAGKVLSNPNILGLIIELNGSGDEYGHSNDHVHALIIGLGYTAYKYDPLSRSFTALSSYNKNKGNTIYLKNLSLVSERCKSAPFRIVHTANENKI